MPRFFHPDPLVAQTCVSLAPAAARHAQVLRLQPGDEVRLFNGAGGEWTAQVEHMGRKEVTVNIIMHQAIEREAHNHVVLAANERMDWLIEKATELGVARLVPLMTERSVLRLHADRALKRQAHWQAQALAACEQCGRNRPPTIDLPQSLGQFLAQDLGPTAKRLLSLAPSATPIHTASHHITVLSGPEGGFSTAEEARALTAGFVPWQLGPRTLRAETAALAALTLCAETAAM
jgi:16S rRNA (uracil1498-N3)-methyltransferase